jgi:CHAT domain-containing protein
MAEAQLEEGIRLQESQRRVLRQSSLQASFFDQAASLFEEMVALQIDKRHDTSRALWFVERARARQLVDVLGAGRAGGSQPSMALAASPMEPRELQRRLPSDVALLYYVSLPDRLLAWALTSEDVGFFEQPVSADELTRMTAALDAAIQERAPVAVVRRAAARLFERLYRPLAETLRSRSTLIVVPDERLQSIPFAALWDQQYGRYLIEDHTVGQAPSGTIFWGASTAGQDACERCDPILMAVGNPQVARSQSKRLPALPGAEREAIEVARLYKRAAVLTGAEATKEAFLAGLERSTIVHFAGHATADDSSGIAHLHFVSDGSLPTATRW